MDLMKQSPYGTYLEHIKKGELAYQVSTDDGKAVFYPRIIAPTTGSTRLEWRVSKGLGTVYATTVVRKKPPEPSYNVALIDLEEGVRMMSRVEGIEPDAVAIGLKVSARILQQEGEPVVVFVPAEA